jgi:hypothetical protein
MAHAKTTTPGIEKLDLRQRYKDLYSPSARSVQLIDVPEFLILAVDGRVETGVNPGESAGFAEAFRAIYGVAYGLKFMSKLNTVAPIDYKIMALEGLWSSESGEFSFGKPEPWLYTMLMVQPDHITPLMFDEAVAQAGRKHPNPVLEQLRLERWREGPSIQIMHIGPYSEEPRTIELMNAYAMENGLKLHGRHHEIYLGDPRMAKPENLKTILRHPVSQV